MCVREEYVIGVRLVRPSLRLLINHLLGLWQYGFLLQSLVARQIKVRYRRSVLGIVWTLLNPILMMIIFTIVFSTLFAANVNNFPIYFLSAFLSWQFFAQSTTLAMTSMINSAPLYKRINVPKYIFVLAAVLSDMINFLLALIPLAAIIVSLGHPLTPAVAFVPLGILVLAVFTTGVSFIVATVCVFFDDITQLYQVLLQAVMYLTAIFYPMEIVPANFRPLISLNPVYHCVEMIRRPLYLGLPPSPQTLVISAGSAVVALVIGWYLFTHWSDRFVYYV